MNVLITGAAGNLGSLLARHLLRSTTHQLRLMWHRRPLASDLLVKDRTVGVQADLSNPATLAPAVQGVDVLVQFAGILFQAGPEKFLPITNTVYFQNLLQAAQAAGVRRVILISFPHVEGPTTRQKPATGRLDAKPISVHAQTRLEEERALFAGSIPEPISLRVGMVYGRGILMVDTARWLAQRRLLGVWTDPTPIHLISREDFCLATAAAIATPGVQGIYHLGDQGEDTLQDFLDRACAHWGCAQPWRMPVGMIHAAADFCELYSRLTGRQALLTRDFIAIGRVPYFGDTTRMRRELLAKLTYPTLAEGLRTL